MAAALLALAGPASADVDQNFGGWLVVTNEGSFGVVSEKLSAFRWWFDTQMRFVDAADGLGQALFRPGLGFAFSEKGSIWLGYNYILNTPPGGSNFWQQQVWQQFSWSEPSGNFSRFWRTRLEQQFIEGQDDVGVRLRQLFRTSIPVRDGSRFSVVGWDEIFFSLRDTDWGANAGFSENRFFIGLGWRVDRGGHAAMELGYMSQYIDLPVNPNVLNHTIVWVLNFR